MAVFEIPLPQTNGAEFRFSTDLSGVRYVFRFYFNERDQSWAIDMMDPTESPIMHGMRAITHYDLLAQVTDPRKPLGYLMLIDTSGKYLPPGRNDLGARVKLTYNDLLP